MADPLSDLTEREINLGGHQLKFVDTSVAWQSFKRIYRNEIETDDDDEEGGKETSQRKGIKNLQDLLENDKQCTAEVTTKKLPYFAEYDYVYYHEDRDLNCEHCRQSTERSDDNRHCCRICERSFHEGCLLSRGFCSDELSLKTMAESTGVVGWSCPNCEGLFNLLSDDEQEEIVNLFTDVSAEDGVIDSKEFLKLQKEDYQKLVGSEMPKFREKQEMELFSKIDRDHTGTIDYWEFLPHMAVRYLSRRSSTEILDLLTPKEVSKFKEFFSYFDSGSLGEITQSNAKEAYINWYKSKIKESGKNYVDFEWYGGLKENHLLQALRETLSLQPIQLEPKEQTMIPWNDYLKHCTLHIISARTNTGEQKPLIPPMPSILYATGGFSDITDDFLRLCEEAKKWTNYLEKKGFTI